MLPLDVIEAARRARTHDGPLADYLASGGDPDDVDEGGKPLLHIAVAIYTGTRTVFKTVRAVLAAGPWPARAGAARDSSSGGSSVSSPRTYLGMCWDSGGVNARRGSYGGTNKLSQLLISYRL